MAASILSLHGCHVWRGDPSEQPFPCLALGLCWFRLVHLFLYQAPLQGVSEFARKRRERGKRRDADTHRKTEAYPPFLIKINS